MLKAILYGCLIGVLAFFVARAAFADKLQGPLRPHYVEPTIDYYDTFWAMHVIPGMNTLAELGLDGTDIVLVPLYMPFTTRIDATDIFTDQAGVRCDGRLTRWTNPNETFDGTDTDLNGCIDDVQGCAFHSTPRATGIESAGEYPHQCRDMADFIDVGGPWINGDLSRALNVGEQGKFPGAAWFPVIFQTDNELPALMTYLDELTKDFTDKRFVLVSNNPYRRVQSNARTCITAADCDAFRLATKDGDSQAAVDRLTVLESVPALTLVNGRAGADYGFPFTETSRAWVNVSLMSAVGAAVNQLAQCTDAGDFDPATSGWPTRDRDVNGWYDQANTVGGCSWPEGNSSIPKPLRSQDGTTLGSMMRPPGIRFTVYGGPGSGSTSSFHSFQYNASLVYVIPILQALLRSGVVAVPTEEQIHQWMLQCTHGPGGNEGFISGRSDWHPRYGYGTPDVACVALAASSALGGDLDMDGVVDPTDNCPFRTNPSQANTCDPAGAGLRSGGFTGGGFAQ